MTQPQIKETCKIVYGSWEHCFERYKKIKSLQKKKHQEIIVLQLDIQENPHFEENSKELIKNSSHTLVWRYGYPTS